MFLVDNRIWYFLELSNSAGDGSSGANAVALQISKANLGSCPDAVGLVRVALTVWTNHLNRLFSNGISLMIECR